MSFGAPDVILHHSRARGTDLVLLMGIASQDGDGGAWPSIATLARYGRISERATRDAIQRLVELGELDVYLQGGGTEETRADRRPNKYVIRLRCPAGCSGWPTHHPPAIMPTSAPFVHLSPPRNGRKLTAGRRRVPRGEVDRTHGRKPTAPEPVLRTNTSPTPPQQRPAWCGKCDERTRWLEHPDTRLPLSPCPCSTVNRKDTAHA